MQPSLEISLESLKQDIIKLAQERGKLPKAPTLQEQSGKYTLLAISYRLQEIGKVYPHFYFRLTQNEKPITDWIHVQTGEKGILTSWDKIAQAFGFDIDWKQTKGGNND